MASSLSASAQGTAPWPDPILLTAPQPSRLSNNQVGQLGEDMAATYLAGLGYQILARNWRDPGPTRGELDLVCRDQGTLITVEVKTRRSVTYGHPSLAVHQQKLNQLRRLTAAYLKHSRCQPDEVRIDVISILLAEFREQAEPASGLITVVAQEFDHLLAVA